MIKEFKDFIAKGNVMDMAVGIIIGAAFTAIVTSLVGDLINPIIGIITGGTDFSSKYVVLSGTAPEGAGLQAARDAGANVFAYGAFLSAVINFLIIAFVVFLLVKAVNRIKDAAVGKDGKGPQAKSGAGRRGRHASSDVTEDPTPPEVPVEAEPEHDEADAAPRIDLQAALTKAVNATSTDDGWATLSLIGQHMSRTHVDFDPRDFGHSKLSTLVEDQPYLRTRTEGRTMEVSLVRRRSRRAEG